MVMRRQTGNGLINGDPSNRNVTRSGVQRRPTRRFVCGVIGPTLFVTSLVISSTQQRGAADPTAFDSAVLDGIREGVYPGAAIVVGRHDTILYVNGYGHLTWNAASATVSADSTLWDLASLTKVVATTPAMMLLVEQGKVVLDSPVVRYVPE